MIMHKTKALAQETSIERSLDAEDDENDEDFVASEVEGSSSDSSDYDSDEGSDEDGPSQGGPADLAPDVVEAVRKALLDDSIALHEEEILSDSELSRQFPDEAEDEEDDLLHLLGHNVIDYTYSATADSDTERDTTRGHSNAGGTAGGSRHTRSRIRHVRVGKSTGLPAVSVVGSYLPEEGGAAAAAAQPPPGDGLNTTTNNMNITTAPSPAKPANSLEVEMNLNFEPLAPIAARTRANVSLTGVPIEDLELGALEEQWLNHGVDDEAEYRRFLQDLHVSFEQGGDGGPGGGMEDGGFLGWGELAEEDSDDEDFLEYMERELMEGMDKDGFPLRASKDGEPLKKRGPAPRPKYKRSANWRPTDRPKYLERLRSRNIQPAAGAAAAADQQPAPSAPPAQQGVAAEEDPFAALDNLGRLASAATLIVDVNRPAALLNDPAPGAGKIVLPSDLDRKVDPKQSAQWERPLPAALRKKKVQQGDQKGPVNNETNTHTTNDPTTAAGVSELPRFGDDGEEEEVEKGPDAGFEPRQLRDLHSLLHQHLQLLVNVHLMATTCGPSSAADASRNMLQEFLNCSAAAKAAMAHLPFAYPMGLLGVAPAWEMLTEAPAEWVPKTDRSSCTMLDVDPLRLLPGVLEATSTMQPPEEEEGAGINTQDGRLKKSVGQDTQQQQQQPRGGASSVGGSLIITDNGTVDNCSEGEGVDAEEGPKKKKRRRGKIPEHHLLWTKVPIGLLAVAQPLLQACDPRLSPQPPTFLPTVQMVFTPAEDKLLAWGIRRYLYDWKKIRESLLPGKTEKQLFIRKKNRVLQNAPQNPVKTVVSAITGPLTAAEIKVLNAAIKYYGKQPRRWEHICRDHLNHRQPNVLATLWAEHLEGKKRNRGGHKLQNDKDEDDEDQAGDGSTETDSDVETEGDKAQAQKARKARIALRRQQKRQQQKTERQIQAAAFEAGRRAGQVALIQQQQQQQNIAALTMMRQQQLMMAQEAALVAVPGAVAAALVPGAMIPPANTAAVNLMIQQNLMHLGLVGGPGMPPMAMPPMLQPGIRLGSPGGIVPPGMNLAMPRGGQLRAVGVAQKMYKPTGGVGQQQQHHRQQQQLPQQQQQGQQRENDQAIQPSRRLQEQLMSLLGGRNEPQQQQQHHQAEVPSHPHGQGGGKQVGMEHEEEFLSDSGNDNEGEGSDGEVMQRVKR